MQGEARTAAARIARGTVLALSIVAVVATFVPLWQPLVLAAVLASTTYGWHRWLTRRLGNRPRVSAMLMTTGLVVLLLGPIAGIVAVIVREAIYVAQVIQQSIETGGYQALIERLPEWLEPPASRLAESIRTFDLGEEAAAGGVTIAGFVKDVFTIVTRVLFGLAMMLIAYVALLLEGPRLLDWAKGVSPLSRGPTAELLDDIRRVSRSVLSSSLLSALSQAVVAGIGYLIAGVPAVFFFAFVTGVAALVPAIGTAIVTLPIAGVLLATGQTWQGIFLLLYWALVISLVDNLVKPLVVRGGMRLSTSLVFFSLIGGLLAFGPMGLLLGPLSVTFFLAMVRFARREYAK